MTWCRCSQCHGKSLFDSLVQQNVWRCRTDCGNATLGRTTSLKQESGKEGQTTCIVQYTAKCFRLVVLPWISKGRRKLEEGFKQLPWTRIVRAQSRLPNGCAAMKCSVLFVPLWAKEHRVENWAGHRQVRPSATGKAGRYAQLQSWSDSNLRHPWAYF
jgi:hypothetical protein